MEKQTLLEIVRFGIVGILATAIHYGIYGVLQSYIYHNIAYTFGYGISFICNFFLTAHFTFKKKATVKKGIGFGLSHLCNYTIQLGLLNLFIYMGIDKSLAPLFVFAIAIPINFLLVRFVFNYTIQVSAILFMNLWI